MQIAVSERFMLRVTVFVAIAWRYSPPNHDTPLSGLVMWCRYVVQAQAVPSSVAFPRWWFLRLSRNTGYAISWAEKCPANGNALPSFPNSDSDSKLGKLHF